VFPRRHERRQQVVKKGRILGLLRSLTKTLAESAARRERFRAPAIAPGQPTAERLRAATEGAKPHQIGGAGILHLPGNSGRSATSGQRLRHWWPAPRSPGPVATPSAVERPPGGLLSRYCGW